MHTWSRPTLIRATVFFILMALLLYRPAPVGAHAFLESSTPPASAVLPTAPTSMVLRFTEPLEPSYSRAELVDQAGTPIPGASSRVGSDPRTLTVQLPPGLGKGTYALLWRTLSTVDGHTAQGYLPFTIGTAADVQQIAPPLTQTVGGLAPEWAGPVVRWLSLLGLALLVGIWPVWMFVLRPAISPTWQLGPKVTRRARAYSVGAFVFALVADVLALLVQAISIAGTDAIFSGVRSTLGETRYGTWWLVRVGLVLVFAAVLLGVGWWWPWRRRWSALLALVVAAALPLPFAMISHAGAEPSGQATAIAFDYVHLLGASLWVGGLFFMIAVLAPMTANLTAAGRRVVLGSAIPRFSLLAVIVWGVLALTGLYSAWLQVGNIPALTETPYGQTLALKLLLILPLLALGAFNLFIVTRRLRQATTEERVEGWSRHFVTALGAEVVIVTILFGVVGILIGTPPARQILALEATRLTVPLSAAGQTGTLVISPGVVGRNTYQVTLGSGHEAHLQGGLTADVSLRVEQPDRQTGQIDIPLAPSPSGSYEGQGSELAFPGVWQLQVTVRAPGQPDWVATGTVDLAATAQAVELPPPPPLFEPAGIAALVLLVLGIAGVCFAAMGGKRTFRKEAAGLGAAAIAVGIVLLLQARIPAEAATTTSTEVAALDPVAVARGRELFLQNCAACHGEGGTGDGPGAAALRSMPANLTTGHSLGHTDEDYAYWIENGIDGTDMPAFGGTLDADQINDVVAYVRSLQEAALLARDAPGPEECTVAPRTVEEIDALAAQGPPDEPPNATETGGVPVDDATLAEITATVRQLVACSNAGDIMRRLAVYSDNRLRFAYPDGATAALRAMAERPAPLGLTERVAIVSIDDVMRLEDGRVRARVIVENPANHSHDPNVASTSAQEAARLVFVEEAGNWRVDETRREDIRTDATPITIGSGT